MNGIQMICYKNMIQNDRIYWVRKGVGEMAFNASD